MTALATRRSLFGAALSLSLAPPIGMTAPTDRAADLYRRHAAAVEAFNADDDPDREDADHERCMALCYATLDAPIVTRADAAAKIRRASQSFEKGELSNGKDVAALEQVAAWLEAN